MYQAANPPELITIIPRCTRITNSGISIVYGSSVRLQFKNSTTTSYRNFNESSGRLVISCKAMRQSHKTKYEFNSPYKNYDYSFLYGSSAVITIEGLKTKARRSLSLTDFSKGNGGNCELKGSSNMLFKGISHYFEANLESLFLSYFFAWAFCLCYFLRFLQLCAAHKWMCRETTWWFCDTSLNVDRTQGVFQSGDGCSAAAHLCSPPIHWIAHMAM